MHWRLRKWRGILTCDCTEEAQADARDLEMMPAEGSRGSCPGEKAGRPSIRETITSIGHRSMESADRE